MKAQTLRRLRQWHLYLGVFFTPAILLFSISGGLQTYRLQEAKGYGGTPPSWIVWMASVHKDQRLPKTEAGADQKSVGAPKTAKPKAPASRSTTLLKLFVALLAAGLSFSALLGATIAIGTRSTRGVSVVMLALGAIVPVAVLYL
jgi:uncharacterized iron-regulated membrane protein